MNVDVDRKKEIVDPNYVDVHRKNVFLTRMNVNAVPKNVLAARNYEHVALMNVLLHPKNEVVVPRNARTPFQKVFAPGLRTWQKRTKPFND